QVGKTGSDVCERQLLRDNRAMEFATPPEVFAKSFGLLNGLARCHFCRYKTPATAVIAFDCQVGSKGVTTSAGYGAVLHFISWMSETANRQVLARAPWLGISMSRLGLMSYLMHHCVVCGRAQDDDLVFPALHRPEVRIEVFERLGHLEMLEG